MDFLSALGLLSLRQDLPSDAAAAEEDSGWGDRIRGPVEEA
jgi:hypothetical protein